VVKIVLKIGIPYTHSANKRGTGERERRRPRSLAAAFGCGVDSEPGGKSARHPAIKRSIPALTQDAPYLPLMPVRVALRALLFNQAACGAGSQQWRSPASDVVKRRVFKQTELFPDRELLGAQFGGVAVVPSRLVAKLDDLICGRVHVLSQRHGALMLHRGEPRHNQIRQALPADRNSPNDWGIAVWASDDRFCWAAAAERALVDSVSPDCFPPARPGVRSRGCWRSDMQAPLERLPDHNTATRR
jgi:hypothetical protein